MAYHATRLTTDRRGAALVEFAIILPLLVCLLMGVLGYGQYFLLAHSVQQIANDAARATVAGTSSGERSTLAQQSAADDINALREFPAARVTTRISESGDSVAVDVALDAHDMALFRTAIVPMPDPLIERRAVVRRGGLS
jgi:Flp pilus assembly protein TadG